MGLHDLEQRSGWVVHHLAVTDSTNEVAVRLVDGCASARTVVVADRQTAGRGRAGRRFASPSGGLYASLLLDAPPENLPGVVVALVAVAVAEAVDDATAMRAQIKWPNDIWLARRKVGGILLELADPDGPVVAGIGLNLGAAPADLPRDLRATVSGLRALSGRSAGRDDLLAAVLARIDHWVGRDRQPGGAAELEGAWRARLALIGEGITCRFAGEPLEGVLEDASLSRGLLIRDAVSGPVWRQAGHVQDLRPSDRTI